MIVGTFTKNTDGSFTGDVETLTFSAGLKLAPAEQTAERAPAYRVYAEHNQVEVGAGWNEKSERTGEPYISVKIDDPSFVHPMWAALTKLEDGFVLRWSRPRPKNAPDVQQETL